MKIFKSLTIHERTSLLISLAILALSAASLFQTHPISVNWFYGVGLWVLGSLCLLQILHTMAGGGNSKSLDLLLVSYFCSSLFGFYFALYEGARAGLLVQLGLTLLAFVSVSLYLKRFHLNLLWITLLSSPFWLTMLTLIYFVPNPDIPVRSLRGNEYVPDPIVNTLCIPVLLVVGALLWTFECPEVKISFHPKWFMGGNFFLNGGAALLMLALGDWGFQTASWFIGLVVLYSVTIAFLGYIGRLILERSFLLFAFFPEWKL